MKTNDIKKGTRIQLNNGWYGTMADNARGNTRMATVEGHYTETGSVYAHDIKLAINAAGLWEAIELTAAQLKLQKQLTAMGW